jgi:hypothetical protein
MKRLRLLAASQVIALGIGTSACATILGPLSDPRPLVYGTSLRPAVGAWVGPSTAFSSEGRTGPDLSVTLETPVTADLVLRGQISRIWMSDDRWVPSAARDVTLQRVMLAGLWFSPPLYLLPSPVTPYAALGFGWSKYDYVTQSPTSRRMTGLHAAAGLESQPHGRVTINGEIQVHLVDPAPDALPGPVVSLLGGMKIRF